MTKNKIKKLSELNESEYNPRTISNQALKGLKYSLDEFGDISGITYNLKTDRLVTGHQRVKALKEKYGDLELSEDGYFVTDAGNEYKVRFVNWDPDKERAANIAANVETIQGTFTSAAAGLIDTVRLTSLDAFNNLLLNDVRLPDIDAKIIEDNFNIEKELEQIKEPKTKPGDIYILGNHRLLCGDSTSEENYKKLLGEDKAHLIFTDPPYNVNYKSASGLSYNSKKFGGSGGKIFNDNKSDQECLEFYVAVLKNLYKYTHKTACIYWWFADINQHINYQAFVNSNWHYSQVIIWLKNGIIFSRGQDYHRVSEPCMFGWKKKEKHYHNKNINNLAAVFSLDYQSFEEQLNVWYQKRDVTNQYLHPTQKPVRLAERALKRHSRIDETIIDVFGGSGSTMIACQQLNRRCAVMELDPKFCDVIVRRYLNFTGKEKIILNNKEIKF